MRQARGRRASVTRCCARARRSATSRSRSLLGDDLLDAEAPGLRQLIDVYEQTGTGVVALKEVPAGQEHMYGIVDGEPRRARARLQVRGWSRSRRRGPRRRALAIIGRYLLPPEIFPILAETKPGAAARSS